MDEYRKKPLVIRAYRWFKVSKYVEGVIRDVGYYRHPDVPGTQECKHCGRLMHDHGWIDTLEGGHTVCPGDFSITGIAGEKYPCKPNIFSATYEAAWPKSKRIPCAVCGADTRDAPAHVVCGACTSSARNARL